MQTTVLSQALKCLLESRGEKKSRMAKFLPKDWTLIWLFCYVSILGDQYLCVHTCMWLALFSTESHSDSLYVRSYERSYRSSGLQKKALLILPKCRKTPTWRSSFYNGPWYFRRCNTLLLRRVPFLWQKVSIFMEDYDWNQKKLRGN